MGLNLIKKLRFLDNKPRKKILFILLLRMDDYITSESLAKELNVTSRTIKKELKELREELDVLGINIESKRSLGYLLKISDSTLENKLKDYYKIYRSTNHENDLQHRAYYVLRMLLSLNSHIKIEDIQNRLFINNSLHKELHIVKKILDKYTLKLVTRPHHGMKIEGKKFKIIMLTIRMYRYFDKTALYHFGIPEFNDLFSCIDQQKEHIRQIIFKTLINYRIVFSDIDVERFLIYLLYFRKNKPSDLEMPDIQFNYQETEERYFVEEVVNKLRTKFDGFDFNSDLIQFLTYIAIFSTDLYRFVDCSEKNYHQLIKLAETLRNDILTNTSSILGIDLFDDYTCMKDLLKIMIPISLKVLLNVSDSIDLRYNDFKSPSKFPVIYAYLKQIYLNFELKFSYSFSDREQYLIFIIICGVINRITLAHKKLNVAIIAIDGRLSTQQLKFNLQYHFSDLIEYIDTKPLYELEINKSKSYDLFVCFAHGKKLGIKYKPISFINEEMDDFYFKSSLKKQFNKAYFYDSTLPAIRITYHHDDYIDDKKIIDEQMTLNPNSHYFLFNKHILLKLNGTHEFFYITRHFVSKGENLDVISISLNLNGDKQKFKMIINILDAINLNPQKLNSFLDTSSLCLTYSELLG